MTAAARILLYSDTDGVEDLERTLAERGYRALPVTAREAALTAAAEEQPDIAIVNSDDPAHGEEMAASLRQAARHRTLPTIIIGGDGLPASDQADLDYLPHGCHEIELTSRLETLARLVTMQEELDRRTATVRAYGVEAPEQAGPPEQVSDARVLLLSEEGADVATLEGALARHAAVRHVQAPHEALQRLAQEEHDAAVVVVGDNAKTALNFCADARSNTRLYNVPVVLLADPVQFPNPVAPYGAGASDVVARGLGEERLVLRTLHQVKLQRYRRAMQQVYQSARHHATSDALTGLFSHGFLHAHLEHLITDAASAGKALSVGLLSIINLDLINQAHGYIAGDRILRQLGGMVSSLVRAEDLPARLSGHELCVVLPDTPVLAAAPVLHRIAGVINFTEFSVPGVETPIAVSIQAGCAGLEPGDTASKLIARARDDIAG